MSERFQSASRHMGPKRTPGSGPSGLLRRACACGTNAGQGTCSSCEKRGELRRRAAGAAETTTAPSIVHDVLRSPGRPLDRATRAFMEPRFGHDFSDVRLHVDAHAGASARAVNALAYTVGSEIVFAPGQFSTATSSGRRLLAHELAHVVQQGTHANGVQAKLTVGDVADPAEAEADRMAAAVEGSPTPAAAPRVASVPAAVLHRVEGPCEDVLAGHPLIIRGSVDPAVREAQRKLNQFHRAEVDAGRPGLSDAPLVEDCIFGPHTFNATFSFQQLVFPDDPREHDGKIGDHTWAQLDGVGTAPPVPPAPPPETRCGPDVTDWFVRQVNSAAADAVVLRIQSEISAADAIARRHGTTAQQVAEGGAAAAAVGQETVMGSGAPARNPTISSQLAAGAASGVAAGGALFTSPLDAVSIGRHLQTAALTWKSVVNHGARFDFKAHTMKRPTTPNCPKGSCVDSITICPGATAANCFLTDLPGNLFYAAIGKFVGWSELTLQLGSQFAQLTGTGTWDPPEDTAAISLGFALPVPLSAADLCSSVPPARSRLTATAGCDDCREPTTAPVV